MLFSKKVCIVPRFQKAIRIDEDFGSTEALDGFIITQSSKESIKIFCDTLNHVGNDGNVTAAFTWTGPFGSGKSSLAVALGSVLIGGMEERKTNAKYISQALASKLWTTLPPGKLGWHVLPIVGRREKPHIVIAEALIKHALHKFNKKIDDLNEQEVISALQVVSDLEDAHGGILIILDEMGQCLEHAASHHGEGINFFQNLAENASRSKKKLIFIGVLHQGFSDYADRLPKSALSDWKKITGRFQDISINMAGEEQVEFLSRAIKVVDKEKCDLSLHYELSKSIAALTTNFKSSLAEKFVDSLSSTWPLHPVVSLLLGPISKKGFMQNQRSIFAFLNSREPCGFQNFIDSNEIQSEIYFTTSHLFDYLDENLSKSIINSSDGHKYSRAKDTLNKAEELGADNEHFDVIKLLSLIEIYALGTGMRPSLDFFQLGLSHLSSAIIDKTLKQLMAWKCVVYRKHQDEYGLFSGSNFDFEVSLRKAQDNKPEHDISAQLLETIELKPILAKRYYHEIGSQQWFELKLVKLENLEETLSLGTTYESAIGQFLYVVDNPTGEDEKLQYEKSCKFHSNTATSHLNVIGMPAELSRLNDFTELLSDYEYMWEEFPELVNDNVARIELETQIESVKASIRAEFQQIFANSTWWYKGKKTPSISSLYDLSKFASELVSKIYVKAPIIKNELVNKDKPSAQAVKARKFLLNKMLIHQGDLRLGIDKYPAEWGIFQSVLVSTGLYKEKNLKLGSWGFSAPAEQQSSNLYEVWDSTIKFLKEKDARVNLKEIYDFWGDKPFGVKSGLHPILIVAFKIIEDGNLAYYHEGMFRSKFDDIDIDYILGSPSDIEFRWMDISQTNKDIMDTMMDLAIELDLEMAKGDLDIPGHDLSSQKNDIDSLRVSKALIAVFDDFHPWTRKSQKISPSAKKIRSIFKTATDPNKLLFDDLPGLFDDKKDSKENIENIKESIVELQGHFSRAMKNIQSIIFNQLEIFTTSNESISELNKRAADIRNISGDNELNSFIQKLEFFNLKEDFHSDENSINQIAYNCSYKPTRQWVDDDYDKTLLKVDKLCQDFLNLESQAYIKGKKTNQTSISVLVGLEGKTKVEKETFLVSNKDKKEIQEIKESILNLSENYNTKGKIILSALGEAAIKIMESMKKNND